MDFLTQPITARAGHATASHRDAPPPPDSEGSAPAFEDEIAALAPRPGRQDGERGEATPADEPAADGTAQSDQSGTAALATDSDSEALGEDADPLELQVFDIADDEAHDPTRDFEAGADLALRVLPDRVAEAGASQLVASDPSERAAGGTPQETQARAMVEAVEAVEADMEPPHGPDGAPRSAEAGRELASSAVPAPLVPGAMAAISAMQGGSGFAAAGFPDARASSAVLTASDLRAALGLAGTQPGAQTTAAAALGAPHPGAQMHGGALPSAAQPGATTTPAPVPLERREVATVVTAPPAADPKAAPPPTLPHAENARAAQIPDMGSRHAAKEADGQRGHGAGAAAPAGASLQPNQAVQQGVTVPQGIAVSGPGILPVFATSALGAADLAGDAASISGADFAALESSRALPGQPPAQLPAGAEPRAVMRQIAEALVAMREDGLDLHLSPEELGRVKLSITQGEAGLIVNVSADRPETLELLRRHIALLGDEFAASGLGDASFSFGDAERDPSGSAARPGESEIALSQPQDVDDDPAVPSPEQRIRAGSTVLDIRL